MTKTSPDQDKSENLKTQTRQKWDRGQKWDIYKTVMGQKWDKMRTVDKNETKVGILTLATSTLLPKLWREGGFEAASIWGALSSLSATSRVKGIAPDSIIVWYE